jgi:hypothetical protein|tara:strand:+ start:276 stop:506 length:231 start_codon:yes stop_codon:yes gene_type:complete
MAKQVIKRNFKINNLEFNLEIYLRVETKGLSNSQDIAFEIFPKNYKAALYAFSNKDKLNKLIKEKYLYEPKKIKSS